MCISGVDIEGYFAIEAGGFLCNFIFSVNFLSSVEIKQDLIA